MENPKQEINIDEIYKLALGRIEAESFFQTCFTTLKEVARQFWATTLPFRAPVYLLAFLVFSPVTVPMAALKAKAFARDELDAIWQKEEAAREKEKALVENVYDEPVPEETPGKEAL